MSDMLRIGREECGKESEAKPAFIQGGNRCSLRRQCNEYGGGDSRDNLIGAGNLRNQPVVQWCSGACSSLNADCRVDLIKLAAYA